MKALVGTGSLARLVLRRDRILLPIWVLAVAGYVVLTASLFDDLFPSQAAREAFAAGIEGSPAEISMVGPVFAPSVGGLAAWRLGSSVGIMIGLASLLTVIRHTRAEEEAGRRELLGATVVGRHAGLTAALAVVLVADLVFAAAAAGGLLALGLSASGSFALALALASVGWVFAAVGALAAQVTERGRAARGMAIAVLALAYVLRIVGDAGGDDGGTGWMTWASPIAWAQRVRPFADERWWVLALPVAFAVVVGAVAYALSARRDLGAGLLPQREGRAGAGAGLRGPLSLAWRLQRGALVAWVAGFSLLGAALGAVADTAVKQMSSTMQGGGPFGNTTDAFFSSIMLTFAEMGAAYAILAALRPRSEEAEGRAEPVLAARVSRLRWAGSHFLIAAVGSAAAVAVLGATAGLAYALTSGGDVGREVPRVLGASLVYVPAVWALGGLAVALYGLAPRLAVPVAWTALAACFVIDLLREFDRIDDRLADLSPFAHVPKLPAADLEAAPLVWLGLAAALLVLVGLVALSRRDLA